MRYWLRGKRGGSLAFLLIAALVAGGLGWVTAAALSLEERQLKSAAEAELNGQLQFALSLLDSRVRPYLAREDSRPYNHYSVLSAPSLAFDDRGRPVSPGRVLEPSPLLNADLQDWMLLHFQVEEESGWCSPQVPSPVVLQRLQGPGVKAMLVNHTPRRSQLLRELDAQFSPRDVLRVVSERAAHPYLRDSTLMPGLPDDLNHNDRANGAGQQGGQAGMGQSPDPGYVRRARQQMQLREEQAANQKDNAEVFSNNIGRGGVDWLYNPLVRLPGEQVDVHFSPMVPLWLRTDDGKEWLLVARLVRIADRRACQGILLDGTRLQTLLASEVSDLLPGSVVSPVPEEGPPTDHTVRTMTALPFQLDPGPDAARVPAAGWTPLRVSLVLAWAAALVALAAVGLGGWSLLDISARRIRFVSAVTHELRTPLTTLRLYLDMLTGGLVRDERQRDEYLHTLHAETERLNRLVNNVLDFSRLENQRPRVVRAHLLVADLVEQVRATWQGRCAGGGKELIVENAVPPETAVETDATLVQQIVGNLIENACKYSRAAEDNRIWLRTALAPRRFVIEVEDRGPGVPANERRAIFQPFCRGREVHASAGGVGLGLALAHTWATALGGRLELCPHAGTPGACFRFEIDLPG
jgi:signal transduction histidine kinase